MSVSDVLWQLDSCTCAGSLRTWFEFQLDAIAQSNVVIVPHIIICWHTSSHVCSYYIKSCPRVRHLQYLPVSSRMPQSAHQANCKFANWIDTLQIRLHITSSHQLWCCTQTCLSVTIREPIQLSRLATSTVKTGVEFGMQSNNIMQCEQEISPRQIFKEYQNLT